jgi:hypothetical protein
MLFALAILSMVLAVIVGLWTSRPDVRVQWGVLFSAISIWAWGLVLAIHWFDPADGALSRGSRLRAWINAIALTIWMFSPVGLAAGLFFA